MKAVTIWQPWAGAIALGWKPVENRTWSTTYRGLLAIHAGAKVDGDGLWNRRYRAAIAEEPDAEKHVAFTPAAVVAVARLVGVHRSRPGCCASEWAMPDAEHWVLANPFALPSPVPCRGSQQLWNLAADVLDAVAVQSEVAW